MYPHHVLDVGLPVGGVLAVVLDELAGAGEGGVRAVVAEHLQDGRSRRRRARPSLTRSLCNLAEVSSIRGVECLGEIA